ncbi:MAG: aldehyde ferredoxin oxidoreductase N-terminal domain-containing protein, partial [Candidatus Moraniibacteriota bacterium]
MQTRILRIDLDSKKFITESKAMSSLEEKLGGFGRAVHRFFEYMQGQLPIRDAFESRNLFRIDLGFLTGSSIMTARRTYFTSLSPLKTSKAGTPGIYYSASSGNFGPALASCNLNAVEITGQSKKPIYLVIKENEVKVMPADELIGKTTKGKIKYLSEKYGKTAGYAVIGPSGEGGKVRFANIAISTHDQLFNNSPHMRFAGRGGLGAVLGKKNVLGIVILRGSSKVEVGGKEINRKLIESSSTSKYHVDGTFWGNLKNLGKLGIGIFDNFQKPKEKTLNEYSELSRESLAKKGLMIKNKGCAGCAIKCWKEIQEKDGTILGKMDWEPSALLGTNLGIADAREILELINLGDDFGMDTISLGVAVGMEMELQNKFGDFEFAKDLIR